LNFKNASLLEFLPKTRELFIGTDFVPEAVLQANFQMFLAIKMQVIVKG
jgi:hypothetical protein